MPYACKFCFAAKGLKGSEVHLLPETFKEAAEHVEREHGYPVQREGESIESARHRVMMMKPERAYTRTAAQALEEALGGPHAEAAALIEATGAILTVNMSPKMTIEKDSDGTFTVMRSP